MDKLPLNKDLFITTYSLDSNAPAWEATASSGKRLSRTQGYQYFSGSVTIFCRTPRAVKQLQAFITSRDGVVNPFYLDLPNTGPLEAIEGTPRVTTTTQAGSSTLNLLGFKGEIVAGDRFTIANDTKVYTFITSGNEGIFEIKPTLRKDVVANSAIKLDPTFYCKMSDDNYTITFKDTTRTTSVKLGWQEVL